MTQIAIVKQLWHYPVKSMLGETKSELDLNMRGVTRDRLFAVQNKHGKIASGKNTRRFFYLPNLFDFSATIHNDLPIIHFPDGRSFGIHDSSLKQALFATFGQELELTQESSLPHMDAGAVHLLTTSSLTWLEAHTQADPRRFRANILLETQAVGLLEQTWLGQVLRIGQTVRLKIVQPTERCAMVGFAQTELPVNHQVLKTIAGQANLNFGVYAEVLTTGRIYQGDAVILETNP
jgi:uncharacterized protein